MASCCGQSSYFGLDPQIAHVRRSMCVGTYLSNSTIKKLCMYKSFWLLGWLLAVYTGSEGMSGSEHQ